MAEAASAPQAASAAWLAGVGADVAETVRDLRNLCTALPDLSPAQGLAQTPRRLARQQFRTLFAQTGPNQAVSATGILLWGVALWWMAAGWPAVLWCALNALVAAAGLAAVVRFLGASPPDEGLRPWEVALGRIIFVRGAVWGGLPFVVPGPLDLNAPCLLLGLLLVLGAGLSLFATYRPAISWFAAPLLVLAPAALALGGGLANILAGAGFLAAGAVIVRLARAQNRLLQQTMLQAEERLALLGELETRRREAQHANQAKTRFLAAAGRDLRQPIQAIARSARVLAGRTGADTAVLGQVAASVEAMDDMLDAWLEASQSDAGALPLNLASFPLAPLLERLRLQFESQAGERGLRLEVRGGAPWVSSDHQQLHRILSNLLSNALRFTPRGGVLVRCRVRGAHAWIQVWDSGVGIARRDQARIFGEFVQVGGHAQAGARQGCGLGLSIVQRLAQRLGHPVSLRSRPGRGSVFGVGVPLHGASAKADGPAAGQRTWNSTRS